MVETFIKLIEDKRTRSVPWAVLNQIIVSAGAVAIIFVLSNALHAHAFGETRFLSAVLAIFAFFSLPGIGPVMLQRMPVYTRESFRFALKTQLRWGTGATIGAFLFAAAYYVRGSEDLARAFVISGALAPIANLYLMPGTVYAGLQRFREKTLFDGFIVGSAVLGASYGAMYVGTVAGTMFWYFGAQALATVLALRFVMQRLSDAHDRTANAAADTRYGKQLTIFQVPFALLPALEKVLVYFLLGPAALALYVVALLPVEHMRGAYRNLLQFFSIPHLRQGEDRAGAFRYLAKIAVLLGAGSIIAVAFFAFALLPVLFPAYAEAQRLTLASLVVLVALPAELYVLSLLIDRRIDYLFSYALITIVIDMLAFVFLTSLFGLSGAVAAKVAASFATSAVAYSLHRFNRRSS